MDELVLPALFSAVAVIVVAATASRIGSLEQRLRALSRVEGKLDALLKHQGIRFDPYGEVPQPVLDALQRGRKIEAIKEYRLLTGAGLKDAKEHVEEIQRRGGRG